MASRPALRVFLDTNVLFSGAYTGSGPPRRLLDAAAQRAFQAVVSVTVLDELARNLAKKAPNSLPYLEWTFRRANVELASEAPADEQQSWYDAGLGTDAPIIAAAVAAAVDYFCTGDARLLDRARTGVLAGLNVVSPADLLTALERAAG